MPTGAIRIKNRIERKRGSVVIPHKNGHFQHIGGKQPFLTLWIKGMNVAHQQVEVGDAQHGDVGLTALSASAEVGDLEIKAVLWTTTP